VNRDFFIGTTSAQGSHYHAGILFLNGAGFRVKVAHVSLSVKNIRHISPIHHHLTYCLVMTKEKGEQYEGLFDKSFLMLRFFILLMFC